MTLTTPGCPVAGIPQQVADAAAAVDGWAVVVELTWEPSWSPERSEDARLALDMGEAHAK